MNFSKIDYSRPFTSGILIAESEDGEYAIVSEVTESEAEETARADYHRRESLIDSPNPEFPPYCYTVHARNASGQFSIVATFTV